MTREIGATILKAGKVFHNLIGWGEFYINILINDGLLEVADIRKVLRHKKRISKSTQDIEIYWHWQVLHFMNWQLKYPDLQQKTASLNTAIGWGKGKHIAGSMICYEKS